MPDRQFKVGDRILVNLHHGGGVDRMKKDKAAKRSKGRSSLEKLVPLSSLLGNLGKRGQSSLEWRSKPTPKQREKLKWVQTVVQLGRQIEKQGQKIEKQRQEIQQLKLQIRKLMESLPHSKRPQ